jgi:hypothetical protein
MDAAAKARALQIVRDIQNDMAADVARHDGAPFNGRTLAEIHAELAATIAGLAAVVERMLEADE